MTDDAVLKMVERELKKQPDISSSDLYEKVAKKHESVQKLSTRQFHARYPLRVKRKMAAGRPKPRKRTVRRKRSAPRAAAARATAPRDVLLEFAQELLDMGADAPFTEVLEKVDRYAGRIAK